MDEIPGMEGSVVLNVNVCPSRYRLNPFYFRIRMRVSRRSRQRWSSTASSAANCSAIGPKCAICKPSADPVSPLSSTRRSEDTVATALLYLLCWQVTSRHYRNLSMWKKWLIVICSFCYSPDELLPILLHIGHFPDILIVNKKNVNGSVLLFG